MTRSFLVSDPNVYEMENVKCYALCPTFADTNLVRSQFENGKSRKTENGTVQSMEQLEKVN